MTDRRSFLRGAALFVAGTRFAKGADSDPFAALEETLGGRIGVMAIDTGSDAQLGHRAGERFSMCSTFKWILAACILQRSDRGKLSLDDRVSYSAKDLLEYAPVTRKHLDRGALSISALCAAAVTVSDNTAANLLLDRIGGPEGFTAFVRECGDEVTRLDRIEPDLNSNVEGDPRDTTTPRAMANTMRTILFGDLLASPSRDRLAQWLKGTTTGLRRLRGGLPRDWVAGDKTGTGANGAANDVAVAWPPGREPVLIAAYLSGSNASSDALESAHSDIAATIAHVLR